LFMQSVLDDLKLTGTIKEIKWMII
jgi:hypothetical protein